MPNTNGHGAKPERVALLMRVSSEEQRDRETIEIQEEFLEQYCHLYELEVADTYKDDGVSGTIPLHERPEGRRLLEDAKEGKFEAVLVYKLDRLGRTLLVIVDAHDRLQEAGVALRSATEPVDTSNPSGRLIFQMLASFAEYERETIRERTRTGLHRALRNGRFPGRIPYGFTLARDERGLEVVENEAAVVREIIANIANGATLYGESKRLNSEGVPSPGRRFKRRARQYGTGWSPATVADIVHQSAYAGLHRVKAGDDVIERPVPAILEPSLQRAAELALEENRHRASAQRKDARRYLLSGLIRCGTCGRPCCGRPVTKEKGGKRYFYYICTATRPEFAAKTTPHSTPRMSAPWLEELVWADVKRFVTNPGEVLERVRDQLGSEGDTEDLAARLKSLSSRLTAKQSEKNRYIHLYAQGHISEAELETYLADLKNQTSNLRLLIEATEADLAQQRERVVLADTTYTWLTLLRERVEEIEEDTPEAFFKRQQLVRLLVERITLNREGRDTTVMITYRFGPPDERAGAGVVAAVQNPEETFDRLPSARRCPRR
jgi:site-specific DNA recombinase